MKKSKTINMLMLLGMFIFSTTSIFLLINYLSYGSVILNKIQSIHILKLIINNEYYIFLLEILWLLIVSFIVRKTNKLKILFIITLISFNVIYLGWRILYTIPSNKFGLVLCIILLISEIIGFFQSTIYSILFYKPYNLKEMKMSDLNKLPTVDVLIMTYNEPSYILRKTIAGCLNIEYPKNLLNIYICDDGHRKEIQQLAKFFGIHYVSRDNNDDAKAGNINNALSNHCKGELFSVLDADMIPKPDYLASMVGYFKEDNVGFVQSPQVFYNPDPFQFNLNFNDKIPNEQDFFMREVQSGRARYNALFHVGTNALFNRKAIDEIGGIPTGSITEDMATGMILESKGYQCLFVNKVLAVGLSAEYYKDFAKQRKRWCRGNIQVSKKWNPLTMKGLNPIQKLLYTSGIIYWFSGVFKMIYILCPIIYLLTGTLIIKANTMQLLQFFAPSYMAYIIMFKLQGSKYRSLILTHIYESATAPFLALASLSELIFSKELKFNVTLKGNIKKNIFVSWSLLLPQFILFMLTILGFGVSLNKFLTTNSTELKQSLIINIAWALYNLIGVIIIMILSLEKPRARKSERKIVNYNTELTINESQHINCRIKDISDSGIGLIVSDNKRGLIDFGDEIYVTINNSKVLCKVVRYNNNVFGCKFFNITKEVYLTVIKFIFENEEGYFHIGGTVSQYKQLDEKKNTLSINDDFNDSLFVEAENVTEETDNKLNIANKTSVKEIEQLQSITNTIKPTTNNVNAIENKQIVNNSSSDFADMSDTQIMMDILGLDKQQVAILQMHKELIEMKKKLSIKECE